MLQPRLGIECTSTPILCELRSRVRVTLARVHDRYAPVLFGSAGSRHIECEKTELIEMESKVERYISRNVLILKIYMYNSVI